jgi:hypothetical protein
MCLALKPVFKENGCDPVFLSNNFISALSVLIKLSFNSCENVLVQLVLFFLGENYIVVENVSRCIFKVDVLEHFMQFLLSMDLRIEFNILLVL